jgi:acetyltransferase EpsM
MVVADIIQLAGEFELVGFLDDLYPDRWSSTFRGLPILGGREHLRLLRESGISNLIVGVGDNTARLSLAELARREGFRLATTIHPGAIIARDVTVADGSVVAAGVVVNPGASIGESVILNTCASIDHECRIADGAHISPGVRLAGGVSIGRAAWVGIGATVVPRVAIGAHSVIGAGSVVLHDVPDGCTAYGVPATIIRTPPASADGSA